MNNKEYLRSLCDSIKMRLGCQMCNVFYDTKLLHFHHLNPNDKRFTISNVVNYGQVSVQRLLLEIEKCICVCGNCHTEIHSDSRGRTKSSETQKATIMTDIKLDRGCFRCGYNKCSSALHFHHIDPLAKEYLVSQASGIETMLAEIEKCIVLCANCHGMQHR